MLLNYDVLGVSYESGDYYIDLRGTMHIVMIGCVSVSSNSKVLKFKKN